MIWAFAFIAVVYFLVTREEEGTEIINVDPGEKIRSIADAIAHAENGVYGGSNYRNNPGNIRDSSGSIAVYPDSITGWQKLYNKIDWDFVSAHSLIYSPAMTWIQVAWMWVCGSVPGGPCGSSDHPEAWAVVVASDLGVDPNSTVAEYLTA